MTFGWLPFQLHTVKGWKVYGIIVNSKHVNTVGYVHIHVAMYILARVHNILWTLDISYM